nr:SGNH/GDSL hydrolase family protein [Mesorhizobium sp.]
MPPRGETITLSELRRRISAGLLTKGEIKLYFEPDEKKSKPFAPALKLTKRVDKEGKRPGARTVTKLYFDAEERLSAPVPASSGRARARTTAAAAARMKVLAEGDSWFRLPNIGWPDDMVDVLRKTYDIPKLAMWGDEIGKMVTTKKNNYLVPLGSGLYRHFMFSGGGNDVLASVGTHVKRFGAAGTDPADANSYIKTSFDNALDTVIGHYGTLAGHVRTVTNPKATLYVHGYAHARPRQGGQYIGTKLEALGFDATSSLARRIVAAMVDRFNVRLKAFASTQNAAHADYKVVYVNLKPAFTSAADWNTDEIHPSSAGAAKAAAIMGDKIAENVPVA